MVAVVAVCVVNTLVHCFCCCPGEAIVSRYIKAYLRHLYPAMFEEAVV